MLTAANVIYAVMHGFNWLTWLAVGLSAIVLVLDLKEMHHEKK